MTPDDEYDLCVAAQIGKRCPRCEAVELTDNHALSRAARDGGAPIIVCPLCGDLEAMRQWGGQGVIPVGEWPVSPDVLGREFAWRVASARTAETVDLTFDELNGGAA